MRSPWNIDDRAFEPMYDESVIIRHKDGGKTDEQTIKCIVYSDSTGEPLSGDAMDTDREEINISCRKKDWAFVKSLKRGDKVIRTATNGKTYAVREAKYDAVMGWVLAARSV